jgi:hypothetical protein
VKKCFSLLLLAAFFFNLGGYYLLFWVLGERADADLSARLDIGSYHPAETFEVKIPLTLPYPVNAESFQRLNGKFEHEGEFYKLVKHRLINDTLIVVLIKHKELKKLSVAFNEFTSRSHQPSAPAEKSAFHVFKLLSDFDREKFLELERSERWCSTCISYFLLASISDPLLADPADPPDFVG